MPTHRIPVAIIKADSACPIDLISNQITSAAGQVGELLAYVLAAGGADEGVYVKWTVPKNYISAPKLVITGILDLVPGPSDVLGFGVKEKIVAHDGAADGAFATEQLVNQTIGSGGQNYASEDHIAMSITLTGTYVIDSAVYAYVFLDFSVTTYTSSFLLYADDSIFFEYSDA